MGVGVSPYAQACSLGQQKVGEGTRKCLEAQVAKGYQWGIGNANLGLQGERNLSNISSSF